jgi:hypothetical protein
MYLRAIILAALTACSALADTLVLKNGNTITGTYLGGDARTIRMTVGDRVESYSVTDVASLSFGSDAPAPAAAPAQPAPAPAAPERMVMRPEGQTAPANPAPNASGIELPAGTTITVRMIDSVDSERDSLGQTFKASLDEPIMLNGDVVIPRGNDVLIKLVNEKQSGKIEGKTSLTLDVVWIDVNGRHVDVATGEVTQASGSRTAKSAKVIGGTAALGAIIGGIAGGGKGAAIGAGAGAGAGTVAQVATHGQQVKIPSETRLTFTLEQPVRI